MYNRNGDFGLGLTWGDPQCSPEDLAWSRIILLRVARPKIAIQLRRRNLPSGCASRWSARGGPLPTPPVRYHGFSARTTSSAARTCRIISAAGLFPALD